MFRYPSNAAWVTSAALVFFGACAHAQAPIIDGAPSISRGGSVSSSAAGSTGQAELYRQLQSLQDEVTQLRGVVEEQGHQLDVLKQQSLDRYMDLDRRLGGSGASAAPANPAAATSTPIDASAPVGVLPAPIATPVAAPGEQEAYKQAFAKLKGQQYVAAIQAFNAFLQDYPSSELVPDSYYWLGKAHLVESPPNLDAADQMFARLVKGFPQHAKTPDALFEQGDIAFKKGDKAKSQKLMQRVIDEYGTSGSKAPQNAATYIAKNFRK